jgi:hypothetical protein
MTDRPTVVGGGFPSPRSGAAWDAARFASLRPARIGRRFAEVVVAERERWSLWTPVGLGTGIALYFALPFEPSIWLGLSSTALALAAVAVARGRPAWMIAALACALVVGGFTVAGLRTHSLAAPILAKPLRPALVSGFAFSSSATITAPLGAWASSSSPWRFFRAAGGSRFFSSTSLSSKGKMMRRA